MRFSVNDLVHAVKTQIQRRRFNPILIATAVEESDEAVATMLDGIRPMLSKAQRDRIEGELAMRWLEEPFTSLRPFSWIEHLRLEPPGFIEKQILALDALSDQDREEIEMVIRLRSHPNVNDSDPSAIPIAVAYKLIELLYSK